MSKYCNRRFNIVLLWLSLSATFGCSTVTNKRPILSNLDFATLTRDQDNINVSQSIAAIKMTDRQLLHPKKRYINPKQYTVKKKTYKVLPSPTGYKERGLASWYGTKFHGFHTANGEVYDMYAMTAAHKTLPLPTYAKVTNLSNGKYAIVKINDRGPFHSNRLIDLSYAAAKQLGMQHRGVARVEIETISDPHLHGLFANQYFQVGMFQHKNKAEELIKQVTSTIDSVPAKLTTATVNDQAIYKVQLGPIQDASSLHTVNQILAQANIPIHQKLH